MKSLVFVLIGLLTATNISAQETNTSEKAWAFYCNQQVALIAGQYQLRPAFSVNAGARYKSFQFGAGAAVNTYFASSVPIYLDLRYTIPVSSVKPFLFANGGFNTMVYAINNNGYNSYNIAKRNPGSYVDVGIGCKVKIGQKLYYTASLSQAYKKAVFFGKQSWGWWPQQPTDETDKFIIENRMVMLRIGLEF
jgi:hypothetical protein